MALQLTPESFLTVIRQSGLIEPPQLDKLIDDFRQQGMPLNTSRAIADALVVRGALTRWQAEKLLNGKHRGFILGKYRLLSLLGKGGMSSVYLAEHVVMRRRCAIKVLPTSRVNDTSYLGRFHREAQAVATLDHPNIVRAYDVDKEIEGNTEIHFLVMEYVDGESLQEKVARSGMLDYVQAVEYIRQAALGLAHAHGVGMIHRDVKPGNLLVDSNDVVKLLDLGLARFFDDGEKESLTVTHDEKVLGTADYLAPEQALDSHKVDYRADIYSLGCTLYFLLTGHPPFTEGTLAQRLMSHQVKEPPPVSKDRPDVPADLVRILGKMMAKKAEERYQTAQDNADALANWLFAHGGDDWRRRHAAGMGSGPVPGQSPAGGSGSQPGGQIATARATLAAAGNTANLAGSDTAPGGHRTYTSGDEDEMIPLAPDGDEKTISAPAALSGSGTKSAQTKPPAPQSAVPPASPVRPASARDSLAGRPSQPVADRTAKAPPPSRPAPPQRRPPQTILARPVADDPDAAEVVPEVVPIMEPVARPRSDIIPGTGRSGIHRGRESSIIQSRKAARDRSMRMLGIGAVVIAAIVIVATIITISSRPADDVYPTSPSGVTGPGDQNSKDVARSADEITVGDNADYRTIGEALTAANERSGKPGFPDIQVIRVAGGQIYTERIRIDATTDPKWRKGIVLMCDDVDRAVLTGPGAEPVVFLRGISKFTLKGFEIRADNKPVAIELADQLVGTQLQQLQISGFSQAGIHGVNAQGLSTPEGRLVFSKLVFRANNKQAVAVELQGARSVTIRECKVFGPLSAGMVFDTDARGMDDVSVNLSILAETANGLVFRGTPLTVNRLTVVNNSFYKTAQGLVFSHVPKSNAGGKPQITINRNLFTGTAQAEAVVEEGDNVTFFTSMDMTRIRENWSDRPFEKAASPKEIDMFVNGGRRGAKFDFVATNPTGAGFLVPKFSSPHKVIGALAP